MQTKQAARRRRSCRRRLVEFLESRHVLSAGLVINELVAVNNTGLIDQDGDHPDWIEIHNTSAAAVDLGGWHLTDDPDNLSRWTFPNQSLPADGYLVVFASGKNRITTGAPLHTNFKLDGDGEYLALVQPDGATIEHEYSPNFPALPADQSYGLATAIPVNTLIEEHAAGNFLVPTGPLADDWRAPGFDDSSWTSVTTGVGYQNINLSGASSVGPVGYWTFDDTPNDASGNGNNAALFGAASYSSSVPAQIGTGKSLNLTGANGTYALVNPMDVSETGLAVSFWFQTTNVARGLFTVAKGNLGAGGNDRSIFMLGNNIAANLKGGVTGETIASSQQAYADGAWHHAVYTFEQGSTSQRIYVDGVLRASGLQSSSLITDQDRIYIGYSPPGIIDYWSGQIDDVAVFNGSLGPSQVSALYNGVSPLELQSYAADIATDVGGAMNGVNATSYLRIPFGVTDLADYDNLHLSAKFDDGFVAYLNGVEIARRNAPATLDWNSTATQPHSNSQAVQFEDIDVTSHVGLLHAGQNVLAIQGLNVSASNLDFLLSVQLFDNDPVVAAPAVFGVPTPGGANGTSLGQATAAPVFSVPGGSITGTVNVGISSPTPGAVVRYTTNRSVPTESSPVYAGPIAVSNSTVLRARSFKFGAAPSPVVTQEYTRLASDVSAFSSNLPVVVVNTFGGSFNEETLIPVYAQIFHQDQNRTLLADAPEVSTRAGMRTRGQASAGFAKQQYALEIWGEDDQDANRSLLGMPEESDWVLYAPYTDKSFLQDPLAFEISRDMGHYAPRTRYVELYIDSNGGQLTAADYLGVYILMEKIKQDPNRVDIDSLGQTGNSAPEVTGGYIFSFDKPDPGPDDTFTTSRGFSFHQVYPDISHVTAAQTNYIKQYMNDFEAALYGPNFLDPVAGYRAYIDVDSFIDHHIHAELTKEIDSFRISTFYHKDRGGKVQMGPVWDFKRGFGNSNYLEGWSPSGWYSSLLGDGSYPYFNRLFSDPNFAQRYVDRWFELRDEALATDHVLAKVDRDVLLLAEAEARDHTRWPVLGQYLWPNTYFGTGDFPHGTPANNHPARTWRDEVNRVKQFVHDRLLWIDHQYLAQPVFNQNGGAVPDGFQLDISASAAPSNIYYTLDGSDPRASGGGVAPGALAYSNTISIGADTTVTARLKLGDQWSAPRIGHFDVAPFDPPPPPDGGGDPGEPPADPTPPTQVQNVSWVKTGVGTTDPRTAVTWSAASDPDSGVDHYRVYRLGSETSQRDATLIFVGNVPTTQFIDNTVVQGPNFRYGVSAVNGSGVEGPLSVIPTSPPTAVADSYSMVQHTALATHVFPDVPNVLLPAGTTWRYLDNGSDQGTAWRALGFDDSGWASGPAQLGYGDGDEQTVVGYGPNASARYPTTYFRKTFSVSNTIQYSGAKLRIRFDDAVSVYLNGIEVVRQNFNPLGTLGDNSIHFDTYSVMVSGDDGAIFGVFTINAAALIDGTNILAVEIHQANGTSADISFDLSLETVTQRVGLLANDSDLDDDPLSAVKVSDPQHGQLLAFKANGTFTYVPDPGFVGSDSFTYRASDGPNLSAPATVTIQVLPNSATASVSDRHVFYNNSAWDGNDPAANAGDDASIATDKTALLPGQTATIDNYTSFSKGLNGISIDVQNLASVPTAADFAFQTGNVNDVSTWTPLATPPSISVRPMPDASGGHRVTLTWPDGTIAKTWLQVTMRSGGNNGLAADDVFYFGNAMGEAGNSATDAQVNAADELAARGDPRNIANPAPVTFLYDYNRDKQVNAADQLISRGNATNLASALRLIAPSAAAGLAPAALADAALVANGDGIGVADGNGQARRRRRG